MNIYHMPVKIIIVNVYKQIIGYNAIVLASYLSLFNPELGRLRQEDIKFEDDLSHTAKSRQD